MSRVSSHAFAFLAAQNAYCIIQPAYMYICTVHRCIERCRKIVSGRRSVSSLPSYDEPGRNALAQVKSLSCSCAPDGPYN